MQRAGMPELRPSHSSEWARLPHLTWRCRYQKNNNDKAKDADDDIRSNDDNNSR